METSNPKSVRSQTELTFKPLTIFAGANSSGKSTVLLQSILLVSQTAGSMVPSRSVVLNGHLTKLGQFDDLIQQGSEAQQIAIGWECAPLSQELLSSTNPKPTLCYSYRTPKAPRNNNLSNYVIPRDGVVPFAVKLCWGNLTWPISSSLTTMPVS